MKHLQKIIYGLLSTIGCIIIISNFISVEAARFEFSPATQDLKSGCRSSISISIDPQGKISNAADIEINYNPNEIEIIDSIGSFPGVQIQPGNAYESYFGNIVNESEGKILLAGGSFLNNLNSRKTFATIEFRSKPNITSSALNIKFDGAGATLDSNIAESSTSLDILQSVGNGSYTFSVAQCIADREAPRIFFINPQAYATNVTSDKEFRIRVTDNQSGINLENLVININGTEYRPSDPDVTFTGNPLDYRFAIFLREPLPKNQQSSIDVNVFDLSGNRGRGDIVFNIPTAITEAVICIDPEIIDIDGDGIPNFNDDDIDGDGIPNEEDDDIDGDGIPNEEDDDVNGDNVNDTIERIIVDREDSGVNSNTLSRARENIQKSAQEQIRNIMRSVGGAPLEEINQDFVDVFAFINILFLLIALFGSLMSLPLYRINDIARDLNNGNPIKNAVIELTDLKRNKVLTRERTADNGEFVFQVRPGIFQVSIVEQKKYFLKAYEMPGQINLKLGQLPHSKDSNIKEGLITRYLHKLAKAILSSRSGLIFVGLMWAIISLILGLSSLSLLILIIYGLLFSVEVIWG